MRKNELAFIDEVIGKIPVVGALWADALHVWMGLPNAMGLAALRDESFEGAYPVRLTIPVAVPAAPETLRRAA